MTLRPARALLLACVFVLGASACAFAFAQAVPADESGFTEHLAQRLRGHAGETQVTVKGPLTLALGELQLNLDRVFNFCRRNAEGCDAEVERYTRSAAQFLKDRNAPPTRQAVRLVVRPESYAKTAQATVQDIQPRPLVEGLVILPVLDLPSTLRMLTERDNKALGLSADDVFQLGFDNLRRALRPLMEEAKPAARGQFGYLQGNVYHSSRLAMHSDWGPLAKAQGGTLVVTAPATDTVLYANDATPTAIDALRALARDVASRARTPLSDLVLRWTPEGWEVVK